MKSLHLEQLNARKAIASFLALVVLVSAMFITTAPKAGAIYEPLDYYSDINFTDESIPDLIAFVNDCTYINFKAICENDQNGNPQVDNNMTLVIEDIDNHGSYSLVIPFVGDGTVYGCPVNLPDDTFYIIYVTGSANIEKSAVYVTFSTDVI